VISFHHLRTPLMSDTRLVVKLGKTSSDSFPTSHGIPQGGALSTLLFAAYMKEPLRRIRLDKPFLFREPDNPANTLFDTEYVDDCDFINTDCLPLTSFYQPTLIHASCQSINKSQNGTPSPRDPTSQYPNLVLMYVLN